MCRLNRASRTGPGAAAAPGRRAEGSGYVPWQTWGRAAAERGEEKEKAQGKGKGEGKRMRIGEKKASKKERMKERLGEEKNRRSGKWEEEN